MGQQRRRYARVIIDDLGFSETHVGVHHLIEVAKAELLALDLDFGAGRHGSGIETSLYMLPASRSGSKLGRITAGTLTTLPRNAPSKVGWVTRVPVCLSVLRRRRSFHRNRKHCFARYCSS